MRLEPAAIFAEYTMTTNRTSAIASMTISAFPNSGVIVAGESRSKGGVAHDVPQRLKGLQTAHYEKLSIAQAFAFSGRQEAYAVESRTHTRLRLAL